MDFLFLKKIVARKDERWVSWVPNTSPDDATPYTEREAVGRENR